jgi:transposase
MDYWPLKSRAGYLISKTSLKRFNFEKEPVSMQKKILFVGLDVDDKHFHAYAIFEGETEGSAFKVKANAGLLLKAMEKFVADDVIFRFCYESTFSGYHLCRVIRAAGHECEIIAAGLIPELSSDRVKNDRLDAEKLARLFMKGLLTNIHIPEEEDEFDRTLIRSRLYLADQTKGLRRHIIAIAKQIGWNYRQDCGEDASYWSEGHRKWLRNHVKEAPEAVKINFHLLLSHLDHLESHLEDYEKKITGIANTKKYKERVKSLSCFRGIKVLSAMTIITELGDIKRFPHPNKIVSYCGMDIAEYSSGGKERRFSMTKMGNRHLRRILIEACQSANKTPVLSYELKKRRVGATLEQRAVADRCMWRLKKKANQMYFKNKPVNKIKAACAREMVGFIWESLRLSLDRKFKLCEARQSRAV